MSDTTDNNADNDAYVGRLHVFYGVRWKRRITG